MIHAGHRPLGGSARAGSLWTGTVFFALASLVWLATRRPGGPIDLFERGHWLGPASDMLAGKAPYRDTFPVHGFLSDGGLDFLVFSLFGPDFFLSLTTHHLLAVLFQPSLYLVAAAATRKPALAAATIPLNLGFATEILADRPVIPLLALAAFLWAIDDPPRGGRAVAAGALAGLGFLYALEFGTFVILAELVTLAFCRWTRVEAIRPCLRSGLYIVGLGAVLVAFVVYLLAVGAFLPFLRTSFLDLPANIHAVWGWDFPTPSALLRSWLAGKAYRLGELTIGLGIAKRLYLAPITAGLGLLLAMPLRHAPGHRVRIARLVAVSVACLLFFRYVVARLHLEVGNALTGPLFFLILVVIYGAYRENGRSPFSRQLTAGVLAAGVFAGLAMNGPTRTYWVLRDAMGYGARMRSRSGLEPLDLPRGGRALVPPGERQEISALAGYVGRQVPDNARILDLTNRPALYFFLRRRNPTRFYQVPLMAPFQDEVIQDLERSPPALVLLQRDTPYDTVEGVPNAARIPKVWRHVKTHFPRRVRIGETLIALP